MFRNRYTWKNFVGALLYSIPASLILVQIGSLPLHFLPFGDVILNLIWSSAASFCFCWLTTAAALFLIVHLLSQELTLTVDSEAICVNKKLIPWNKIASLKMFAVRQRYGSRADLTITATDGSVIKEPIELGRYGDIRRVISRHLGEPGGWDTWNCQKVIPEKPSE